jgi:hypothetical protein
MHGLYPVVTRSIRFTIFGFLLAMCLAACAPNQADPLTDPVNPVPTPNSAPTISGSPATTVQAGAAYMFRPTAADADGDALTFSIVNAPTWSSFDTTTGEIQGTPANSDVGPDANIQISVTDGHVEAQLAPFTIAVQAIPTPPPANTPPTISGSPATTVTAGQAYRFVPTASDADGDTLTYSIANKPSWASFSTSTGRLSGTPASGNVGTYSNIIISVSDGSATASLQSFAIGVQAPANRPPTISGSPSTTVVAGSAYTFQPTASDPDGNTLTFSVQGKPTWATFNATSGRLSGTPTSAQVGTYPGIVISVSDGTVSASLPTFTISVTSAPNAAPTISGTPASSVNVGSAYSFTPTAADANGDTLTFSIQNKPSWAAFTTSNGNLSGTPAAADVATYSGIVIAVTDGKATTSLAAFSITVNQVANGSATVSWMPPTQNTDGSALTNLAGFHIYYGMASNALDQSVSLANPGLTTYAVSNLSPGTWYFSVKAVNSAGAESDLSNIASKIIQ